ncbi:hypothetical protein DFH08DRAFT_800310 [Mycena albidolilacea]|uniref:CxC2-like cysteine cluster KDZ transposase-associated domain-containing protein n=1 Tax=Mycena albidolilacea TaxID=1033008 RepID=A0AAD7AJR8_9AGAR|nr:hypothetical protein DFH08DRAFT_800310 [Mycena albidolilacea]
MVDLALESAPSSLQLSDQSSFYPRQGFEHTRGSETAPFYVVTQGRIPGIYTHWEEASHQVNRFPSAVHKRYIGWSEATAAWDAAHRPPALLSHQSTPSPAQDRREAAPAVRAGLGDGSFRCIDVTTPLSDALDLAEESALERSGGTGRQPAKRAKNVYLLQSFGHSLNDDAWVDVADPPDNDTATLGHDAGLPARRKRKRKWYATTDNSLGHWVDNFCDAYLRVLMTREGTMGQNQCPCGRSGKYRCGECFGVQMYCQLGHPDNQPCSRARPGHHKFVVIAANGFHHVTVDFCECRQNGSQFRWEQLLSYGWYPSTPDAPKSAVTISALKLFHTVSLQGKTTVYHFFNALAKITDNTGSRAFKRRYQLVLRVVRQWWNLRALKRGGMGNDPERLSSETHQGELTVDCLACPKVGVNLPEDWEKASPEESPPLISSRFLYTVYWAMGACFHLKGKNISSWSADPSIQDGWAYFTKWGGSEGYGEFDRTLGQQQEGYRATGCGMVTCGRHKIVAKNGVGNLQAGEKPRADVVCADMGMWTSFLLAPGSTSEIFFFFLLSYNIMCQWSKNLKEHLLKLPPAFVIPKLHILGHLRICQEIFSLLFTLGAAQADMEGIERIWSSSGLMGMTLRNRFVKASKELGRQQAALPEFIQEQEEQVSVWRKLVDDFESGASAVNPYEHPKMCQTLREVELELMREEQEREHVSAVVREASKGTMTEYLMLALEVEGQQRELAADLLANRSPTTKDLTDFVIRHTQMSRQVKKIRALQRKYSPGTLQHLATAGDAVDAVEPERIPLLLPSTLSTAERLPPLSVEGLAAAEAESLDQMRHDLTVKKRLHTYKDLNSRRQHQTTRSRGLLDNHQRKINKSAATYRQARLVRLALIPIAGSADWRPLHLGDMRMMEDEEEAKKRKQRAMKGKRKEAARENEYGEVRGVPGLGENTRLVSWIWQGGGQVGGVLGEEIYDGVKVEWCKAYARVKRWREELLLLQEEMVRCLRTLEWQAGVWDARAAPGHYQGKIAYLGTHLEGAMAFAARQAVLRRMLATRFRRLWWCLTDRISGPEAVASSESSGVDEADTWDGAANEQGNNDDLDGADEEDAAPRQDNPAPDEAAPEEMPGEMSTEEETFRRAKMDALLALQSTSMGQVSAPACSAFSFGGDQHGLQPNLDKATVKAAGDDELRFYGVLSHKYKIPFGGSEKYQPAYGNKLALLERRRQAGYEPITL